MLLDVVVHIRLGIDDRETGIVHVVGEPCRSDQFDLSVATGIRSVLAVAFRLQSFSAARGKHILFHSHHLVQGVLTGGRPSVQV